MAGVSKLAQKVPSWVERMLVPTLDSRVRSIVKEELGGFEKTMEAKFETIAVRFDAANQRLDSLEKSMLERFEGVNARFEGADASINRRFDGVEASINSGFDGVNAKLEGINTRFDSVDAKLESLAQQLPTIKETADLRARLAEVERRTGE